MRSYKAPEISVIIPTRNRPELLKRAVNSVIRQTYRPIEIIIVDDFSNERVESSWFNTDQKTIRIKIIRNTRLLGVSASRNKGITSSEGTYIAFLDDDDYWLPKKLQEQMDFLRSIKSSLIQGVFCQMIIQDHHGKEIRRTHYSSSSRILQESIIFQDGNIPPPTLLVTKYAFNRIGLFNTDFSAHEDREWGLRYLKVFDLLLLEKYLVINTEHSGQRLTLNQGAMLKGELAFTKFMKEYTRDLGEAAYRKAVGYRYAKLGNEYLLTGHFSNGIRKFVQALLLRPLEIRAWAGLFLGLCGVSIYRKVVALRMGRVHLTVKRETLGISE